MLDLLTLWGGAVWVVVVALLGVGIGRAKRGRGALPDTGKWPMVSVLVAARNEEKNLPDCIEALQNQDYPEDRIEFLIIDDHSTDGTNAIITEWSRRDSRVHLISPPFPQSGLSPKKAALSAGIEAAKGEIILTTDADCQPPRGWVRGMVGCFSPSTVGVIGVSPLQVFEKDNREGWRAARAFLRGIVRLENLINGAVMVGSAGWGKAVMAAGRNLAYRRSAFLKVGGFGETGRSLSGDDDLLVQRLRGAGEVVVSIDPGTFVPSRPPGTIGDWWRTKRRHLSAGRFYPRGWQLISGMLYLFNLALLLQGVKALGGWGVSLLGVGVWMGKVLADGWTLSRMASILREKGIIVPWLIGEILSPAVIVVLLPLALVGKVEWKGRVAVGGVVEKEKGALREAPVRVK